MPSVLTTLMLLFNSVALGKMPQGISGARFQAGQRDLRKPRPLILGLGDTQVPGSVALVKVSFTEWDILGLGSER